MHTKWQIWDFFYSFPRTHLSTYSGLLAINTFDPICLKMLKDFLIKGSGERIIHHKVASEVSRQWIEDEFQTLSLFGGSDCFFIHQAQDLKTEILDEIATLNLSDRFVIFCFESESLSWKKLLKDNLIPTLVIEPPRFWEVHKLLDFVTVYLRLPLSYEAKNWILDSLENDLFTFYNAATLVKLNFPDSKEIGLSQVKDLLTPDRLDQFMLASLFCRKKTSDFFERLIQLEGEFNKMRSLFNFMQGHLIKVADSSYLSSKSRLTQYDKDIQGASKLWNMSDLVAEIERFNQWEICAKKKSLTLWKELRLAYLRSI
jgi:DNA polymerase III delta subunit